MQHKFRTHPLRKGRVSLPFHYYSVTIITQDRQPTFSTLVVNQSVIQNIYVFDKLKNIKTICFCLMPDHLHWMFQLQDTLSLSEVVGQFKGRTTNHLNKNATVFNRVWQQDYYDHGVRSENDLRTQARYIVANPLRSKLVDSIGNYPFWNCIYL
jgi:putative transposase